MGAEWGIARRPSLRFQYTLLGVFVAGLVLVALVADSGDGPDPATPTSTTPPGVTTSGITGTLPPADPETTVCGTLPPDDATALVGHPLPYPPTQPILGQCAWPDEEGGVIGELYLVVAEREADDLRTFLETVWEAPEFRVETAGGLGDLTDEAYFVIRVEEGEARSFVVGLEVYAAEQRVVLGNGARDTWEGSPDEVRARLESTMRRVLDRLTERLG